VLIELNLRPVGYLGLTTQEINNLRDYISSSHVDVSLKLESILDFAGIKSIRHAGEDIVWERVDFEKNVETLPFTISPNPASSKLTVSSEYKNYRVKITDLRGVIIQDEQIIGFKKEINLRNSVPGVYLIIFLKNDVEIHSEKVVLMP
jgi:hypothetical protein